MEAKEHALTEKIHQNESPGLPEEQIEVIFTSNFFTFSAVETQKDNIFIQPNSENQ